MNTKNNYRSVENRMKLKKAVLILLDDNKTIHDLTVMEICKTAGINRCTFYTHYTIPADILSEIEDETINNLSHFCEQIKQNGKASLIEELKYIKENYDVFKVLYLHSKSMTLLNKFEQITEFSLNDLSKKIPDKSAVPYFYSYVLAGSKGIIFNWIKTGMIESEEYIADLLFSFNDTILQTISKS